MRARLPEPIHADALDYDWSVCPDSAALPVGWEQLFDSPGRRCRFVVVDLLAFTTFLDDSAKRRLQVAALEDTRHYPGVGEKQGLHFVHLHVRYETPRIARRVHFGFDRIAHRRLDHYGAFPRLFAFCLLYARPVLRKAIIIKERAHMTAPFLVQQCENLLKHGVKTADAAFMSGLADSLGMKRQSTRTEVRSKSLLDDGALGEALDDSQNPMHGLDQPRSRSFGEALRGRSPSANPPTIQLPADGSATHPPRARPQ